MSPLPITRAELERILQEYDRPIITGRGVCTFSENNRSYVQAARQWQPAYWALVTNAARDDMVWEFIRYAEEVRGWVFIMRHDDGINFVLMPNEAKREKVSRLLGERPRVRNPAVVAPPPPPPPPPPQHPLIVDVRPDNTDRVATGHTHQVASPTQSDVASQRRPPSDASMESSHASRNGILPSLDADAEDLGMEAEVDTDAVTVFSHDTLMEMAMGICSVGSMDSLQLQYAFASPLGMDVAFERTMD